MNDGNDDVDVLFTNDMANANYCVVFGNEEPSGDDNPYVTNKATTVFRINATDGTTKHVSFVVFGTLA